MSARSAIPGLKRLPKPGGCFTWYWAASQISRKAGAFRPRTVRLWHGAGEPTAEELAAIVRRADVLATDLREWLLGRRTTIRRAKRGFVYVVRAGERVKIGFTQDVGRRIAQLQLFFPDELELLLVMPGSILDEHELHRRFERHALGREWFVYAPPIAAYVARMRGEQAGNGQNRILSESLERSESHVGGA